MMFRLFVPTFLVAHNHARMLLNLDQVWVLKENKKHKEALIEMKEVWIEMLKVVSN